MTLCMFSFLSRSIDLRLDPLIAYIGLMSMFMGLLIYQTTRAFVTVLVFFLRDYAIASGFKIRVSIALVDNITPFYL